MPPKRKVSARRASSGKLSHVNRGSASTSALVTASGRPRREATKSVDYSPKPLRAPYGSLRKQAKKIDAAPAFIATPEKRGRPAKSTQVASTTAAKDSAKPVDPTPRPRGRPKAVKPSSAAPTVTGKRKRDNAEVAVEPPAKRRGRPPKSDAATVMKPPQKKTTPKSTSSRSPIGRAVTSTKSSTTTGKKRGTKKITKADPVDEHEAGTEDFVEALTQSDEADDSDSQYWLMKAEPDLRIEKDVDISFPIDKLAAATEPEPWDGVRNAVARNNMRAMRKGELAFFYHSNCKIPGIVGVMRIAEEHAVDESAFDPAHPYYDEKSDRAKPKWDCVKVEFVKKFTEIVTLNTVKTTKELQNMQLASKAYSRLSVQKVTPAQWRFILKMAGEPEDLGVVPVKSGYEADTNGETDKEAEEESIGIDDVDAVNIAAYGSANGNNSNHDPLAAATAKAGNAIHVNGDVKA